MMDAPSPSRVRSLFANRLRRALCGAAAGLAAGAATLSAPTQAQLVATPDDNLELAVTLGVAGGSNVSATLVDVFNPFIGLSSNATALVALGTSHALKGIPPIFDPPPDRAVRPDRDGTHDDGDDCRYAFRSVDKADYKNLLHFIPLQTPKDTDWSVFSRAPTVLHSDSDVRVSVSGLPPAVGGIRSLPEGEHELQWVAATQYSPVFDTAIPLVLLGISNKVQHAKNANRASRLRYIKRTRGPAAAARESDRLAAEAARALNKGRRVLMNAAQGVATNENLVREIENALASEDPYLHTSIDSAFNTARRVLTVEDLHPPFFRDAATRRATAVQSITVEATDFGGVAFSRVIDQLRAAFDAVDPCGRPLSTFPLEPPSKLLITPDGASGDVIEWRTQDKGPYTQSRWPESPRLEHVGTRGLRARLAQRVLVVDTQAPLLVPPPGFARYADADIDLPEPGFSLGSPRVSDLADPHPEIASTAPDVLEVDQRHLVEWTATDDSGNASEAARQIVTLKTPGTNTPPRAFGPGGRPQTLTSQRVEITLTGVDDDYLPLIDGAGASLGDRADPLEFQIVDPPRHGVFEAPLLPFFIEDLRLKPDETPGVVSVDELACPARSELDDGKVLSDKLGQLVNSGARQDYIEKCYCGGGAQPPHDLMLSPRYAHVADDDTYYVTDSTYRCNVNDAENDTRVSKWKDGEYLGERGANSLNDAKGIFDVDQDGRLWWFSRGGGADQEDPVALMSVDENLQPWAGPSGGRTTVARYSSRSAPGDSLSSRGLIAAHADVRNRIIYVTDKFKLFAFDLDADDPGDAEAYLGAAVVPKPGNPRNQGFLSESSRGRSSESYAIQTDSRGNVYIVDDGAHRIHKFGPPTTGDDGKRRPGDYIGWMGSCTGNKRDPVAGVPFNACDVETGASRGYLCTDIKCERAGFEREFAGAAPGQFDQVRHINMGPSDILYVADFGNSRVQRFSPDGTFAGEAVSETEGGVSGSGEFVLGNMGRPRHVSVNSTSFHVLEHSDQEDDFFLHIFRTLPFDNVTDDSVTVTYVSDFDFQGAGADADTFSFRVNDGIDVSEPARVRVDVSRAFRPPTDLATRCFAVPPPTRAPDRRPQVPCQVPEDGQIYVQLHAQDPDGFIGFGGLDTHSFELLSQPANGTLELVQDARPNRAEYRYVPDADFHGTDEWQFQASDGAASAETAGVALLTVLPVPDAPVLELPDRLTVGRGFRHALVAEFTDADEDPDEVLEMLSISWGDGAVASFHESDDGTTEVWRGHGLFDDEGGSIHPVAMTGVGAGLVQAAHTYVGRPGRSTAPLTIRYSASGPVGAFPLRVSTEVDIREVTHVTARLRESSATVQPGQVAPLQFVVTNQRPAPDPTDPGWAGRTARNVAVVFDPPSGLTLASLDTRCDAPGRDGRVRCVVGSLTPGASVELDFTGLLSAAAGRSDEQGAIEMEVTDDGPRLQEKSLFAAVVQAADEDSDGVIDIDDAFPADGRYSQDADRDGIADEWEHRFGLSSATSRDAGLDPDRDGVDNLDEFRRGGFPLLQSSDAFIHAGVRLDPAGELDDRFGITLGAGDIDGDGYSDQVIGAPNHLSSSPRPGSSRGTVYVRFGSASGTSTEFVELSGGIGPVGGSVAVDDFDGNGFADIALSRNESVALYLNDSRGIDSRPTIFGGSIRRIGFGATLGSGDVDNDGVADLLVRASSDGPSSGAVYVYLARDKYFEKDRHPYSKRLTPGSGVAAGFGSAMTVADVDNDGDADLLVGAANSGRVSVYLGKDTHWAGPGSISESFQLRGAQPRDSRFGHALSSGDVDGDGVDDVLAGDYREQSRTGAAYVYRSRDAWWREEHWRDGVPPWSQRLVGESAGDQFGVAVAVVGRIDGDRYADAAVGANRGGTDGGALYVYAGGPGDITLRARENGPDHHMLGYFVASAGDANGDRGIDLIAGAPHIDVDGAGGRTPTGGFAQVYTAGGRPLQADADADRVADVLDNCVGLDNTDQRNLDGDALGDACDDDMDGDGVANDADVCPNASDRSQLDSDRDGDGNACDSDDDNDNVDDAFDNCPLAPNPGQLDSDGDGDGDACDKEPADGGADEFCFPIPARDGRLVMICL